MGWPLEKQHCTAISTRPKYKSRGQSIYALVEDIHLIERWSVIEIFVFKMDLDENRVLQQGLGLWLPLQIATTEIQVK